MKTTHQILRARLKVPLTDDPADGITMAELQVMQWCPEFERLMRNRLLMGAMRYAPFSRQEPGAYDNCGSALSHIRAYQATGNTEHLVDAANLMLCEFKLGVHPKKHFAASDDGEHVQKL